MKTLGLFSLALILTAQVLGNKAHALEFYSFDFYKQDLKLMEWDSDARENRLQAFFPGHSGAINLEQDITLAGAPNSAGPKALFGLYEREELLHMSYPHRTVGLLNDDCTGTLVGPRHVLTAAHCIYDFQTRSFLESIQFTPAQNKHVRPYGAFKVRHAYMPKLYEDMFLNKHDYALLILDKDIGHETGWMGFAPYNNSEKSDISIVGYPGDKKFATPWKVNCPAREMRGYGLFYKCDTYGGMSGAPIMTSSDESPRWPLLKGIHTTARYDGNLGRIMDAKLARLLVSWMRMDGHQENEDVGVSVVRDEKFHVNKEGHKLYLTNSCRKPVRVAVHYKTLSGLQGIESWVYLNPGQRREVVAMKDSGFRFFAETVDQSYRWSSGGRNCRKIPNESGFFCFIERKKQIKKGPQIIEEELNCQQSGVEDLDFTRV